MTRDVNAALTLRRREEGTNRLLRDCMSLGTPARRRPSARVRLDEAIGRDLARLLVTSLTARGVR